MTRTITGVIAAIVLFLASADPARAQAPQPPVRLDLASAFPGNMAVIGEAAKRLPIIVARASGGDLEIKFHEPGVLAPAARSVHAVSQGTIDAAWAGAGWFADKDSAFNMFSAVPFGPDIGEYMAWMYHGGGLALARALFAKHAIHNIPCAVIPPEASGWFRKEVQNVADLKGLRMRFFGLGAKVVEKLGVETRQLPPGDILNALQLGSIDAAEFSLPAIDQTLGFSRVLKFYYFPGWHQQATFFDLYVHKPKWDALAERHKAVIELACSESIRRTIAEGEAAQWQAMQAMQAQGVQIRRWPPDILAAYENAWRQVVAEERSKSASFAKVWDSYSAFRQAYALWGKNAYLR